MAKKCKSCAGHLASGDKHLCCAECRTAKKGEDPCTLGKNCKYCESLTKMAAEKKVKKSLILWIIVY